MNKKYVTREQAKFLKEKGFDYHNHYNDFADYYDYDVEDQYHRRHDTDFDYTKYPSEKWIPVPEQYQVIDWLLETKNIWIEITYGKDHNNVWFDYEIYSTIKPCKDSQLGDEDIDYEDEPNEKFLNYETSYNSLIDSTFEIFKKKSSQTLKDVYSDAFDYIIEFNLI